MIFLYFLTTCLVILLSYFIGSFPTGFLVGKYRGVDLRKEGSGNTGATNTLRILGKKWGYLVFVIDLMKGALAILLTPHLWNLLLQHLPANSLPCLIATLSVVLGHNFPCWLQFRGGKGVATSAGAMLALFPIPSLFCLIAWGVTFQLTRYVSLASLVVAALLPLQLLLLYLLEQKKALSLNLISIDLPSLVATFLLAAMIFWRHRSNLQRLLSGQEYCFSPQKKNSTR
jgi:acyl phosphate:glycerol-3-phosphate acyltransferase